MIAFFLAHIYIIGCLFAAFFYSVDYTLEKDARELKKSKMTPEEIKEKEGDGGWNFLIIAVLSWFTVALILGDWLGQYIKSKGKK